MNINMHNNIAMMSSMVGIPQNSGGNRQVNKEQGTEKTLAENDLGTETTDETAEEESSSARQTARADQQKKTTGARQQTQTHAVQQKSVSEESKTEEQKKTSETSQQQKAGQTGKTGQTGGLLDTSKLIQLGFQKAQEAKENQEAKQQRPDIQRKQFAENLKKWVDVEYKQYVKDNDPLYSRRNLREILQALGDSDTKTQKKDSAKDSTGKNTVSFSKFNKYNITQASTALKLFTEISSVEDPTYANQGFDLVA